MYNELKQGAVNDRCYNNVTPEQKANTGVIRELIGVGDGFIVCHIL